MSNADLIERFAKATYDYNQISADRRRQQPKVLAVLGEHTGKDLVELTGRDLRDYLATRLAGGTAATTLGKHLAMIRPFYGWLYQEGIIKADQLLDVREVRAPRGAYGGEPRPYNEKEIPRLWRDLDRRHPWGKNGMGRTEAEVYVERWARGTSPWKRIAPYAYRLQMEAVIALAMYGGLRRDEIFRLEVEKMHHDNAYVLVEGARKNRHGRVKERGVPWVLPAMRTAVEEWLTFRARIISVEGPLDHDRPWLTIRPSQHRLTRMKERHFGLLLSRVGPWEFHRLRHTAATEMLRAGYELEVVREVMGHADIQMTLRYARILTDDILKTARRSEKNLAGRMERLRAAGGSA